MKLYFKIIITILIAIIVFGIILPFLISYPDTLLVWIGIAIALSIPIILFLLWKKEIKILKEKIKE